MIICGSICWFIKTYVFIQSNKKSLYVLNTKIVCIVQRKEAYKPGLIKVANKTIKITVCDRVTD